VIAVPRTFEDDVIAADLCPGTGAPALGEGYDEIEQGISEGVRSHALDSIRSLRIRPDTRAPPDPAYTS